MRRYSPSQTETFLQCPRKRAIRKLGWEPSRLGKPGLARLLGTAFAAGVGAYNTMRLEGAVPDVGAAAGIAQQVAKLALVDADERGMVTSEIDMAQRGRLVERAGSLVEKYAANDPIPPQWQLRHVELTLAEWGNARIDLGYENELGYGVLDYKSKLTLDPKWFDKEVNSYKYSEQRWFYPAAYEDYLRDQVVMGDTATPTVHRFDICLVILEPKFRTHLIPFIVNPTLQAEWLHDRETTWALMEMTEEDGILEPWMAAKHEDQYGPCEFQKYCFDFQGDPHLAAASGQYVPTKAKEPVSAA
jgi:hypothetical protein